MSTLSLVAQHLGVKERELQRLSLLSLLKEKKNEIMRDKLEILSRNDASSTKEIKEKIKKGRIKEHPAWEDLIVLENLDSKIKEIEHNVKTL